MLPPAPAELVPPTPALHTPEQAPPPEPERSPPPEPVQRTEPPDETPPLDAAFTDLSMDQPASMPPSAALPPVPTVPAPPPPAAAAPPSVAASPAGSSNGAAPIEDIVLGSSGAEPRAVGATSLAATIEIIEHAGTIADLQALLQQECVRAIAVGIHADAVARCVQYVTGLARSEERVLCGWPVLSINEWGSQQTRTMVLSSHALYRVAFSHAKGAIDHYSRTSLGSIEAIERGRFAFKLMLTEPDGRENPLAYFWTAYVKKGAKDNRYERVYYPIHSDAIPVELALAVIISSISVANKLLVEAVGAYCYVSKLVVRDYVPNPNAVDELMDKLAPSLKVVGDKVSETLRGVLPSQPAASSSSARSRRNA